MHIFLEKTNALHDGYVISVQYRNDGISKVYGGHCFSPEQTKLTLQILVTSIWDAVVELEFEGLLEWQIKDNQWEILDTAVLFDEKNRVAFFDIGNALLSVVFDMLGQFKAPKKGFV